MTEFIFGILRAAARTWDPPHPWGIFHTLFFCLGIPLAVMLALAVSRLGETGQRRVFFGTGLFLALTELFKQFFYVAAEGSYRFDLIPFQLCSVPMYLCLVLPWLPRGGRGACLGRALRVFLATYGLMGGAASMIAPGTMLRPYVIITVHSFVWHLTLIFLGVLAVLGMRGEWKLREFGGAAAVYFAACAAAFCINLLCLDAPGQPVNMFYLGPQPSGLVICRDIVARYGWVVNLFAYTLTLTLGAGIIWLLWGGILRPGRRREKVTRRPVTDEEK